VHHTRRHTTAALLAAVLLTGATGCGSDSGDGKPAATPKPSPSVDRAGQYITASQNLEFTTMRPSNDELLTYPPKWCKALEQGHSVKWMFSIDEGGLYPIGMEWGMKKKDANQLLLAGVKAYCPKHTGAVTKELRAAGEY